MRVSERERVRESERDREIVILTSGQTAAQKKNTEIETSHILILCTGTHPHRKNEKTLPTSLNTSLDYDLTNQDG